MDRLPDVDAIAFGHNLTLWRGLDNSSPFYSSQVTHLRYLDFEDPIIPGEYMHAPPTPFPLQSASRPSHRLFLLAYKPHPLLAIFLT